MITFCSSWARTLRALGVTLLLTVIGCGGGVETGGTGPTGSSFVEGPVSGFGSVIVAGIRFESLGLRHQFREEKRHIRRLLRAMLFYEQRAFFCKVSRSPEVVDDLTDAKIDDRHD